MRKFLDKISWDDYFMKMALLAAQRSSCLSPKGAIIVKDNAIISTGYNGASKGCPECRKNGECLKRKEGYSSGEGHEICPAAHAELNAIVLAAKNGNNINEATLYCTHYPCSMCMRYIANSGIKKVIYLNDYPDKNSTLIANYAKIETVKIDLEEHEL